MSSKPIERAQPKTYMLLPTFDFSPDGDVQLGTILGLSKDTKLPDPDIPLNEKTRIEPADDKIIRSMAKLWAYKHGRVYSGSGAIDAEVPFQPAQGGLGFGRSKDDNLAIKCEWVKTQRFVPPEQYVSDALKDPWVSEYCRKHWRPNVYLVTGLKVAHNAVIGNGDKRGFNANANASVDASGLGVPIKAGPRIDLTMKAEQTLDSTVEGSFILAYQLKRLRLKRDGTLKSSKGHDEFAFCDDRELQVNDSAPDVLNQYWDIEDVTEEAAQTL